MVSTEMHLLLVELHDVQRGDACLDIDKLTKSNILVTNACQYYS